MIPIMENNRMSDHFPIVIDVEEAAVGKVLRLLNSTPGILTIHLQLAQASTAAVKQLEHRTALPTPRKQAYLARVQSPEGPKSVRQIIAEMLSHSPMHLTVLGKALAKSGYSEASLHSAITKMLSDRLVIRTAPGTYRLTKKGEKKYLSGTAEPERRRGVKVVNNKAGVRQHTLRVLEAAPLSNIQLAERIVEGGYSRGNMYNAVSKMKQEGLIKRTGDIYEITEMGRAEIVHPPKPDQVVMEEKHSDNGEFGVS